MADGTVTIKIKVDGKEVEAQLSGVERQIDRTAEKASDAGESTQRDAKALGLALGTITASLVAAGLKAYEFSSQFNAAFAKTQTIMDQNVMAAEDMRAEVLRLSKDSAMAAEDVSEAVYQAISGSVDTADAVAFVDKANKLAVAGFTSLTNSTDVLTTALNSYHLSADKVDGISNVLIRTQNLGKTSVDELSSSMGKAIATGSAYNVNLENLSTAYVELTKSGIATAESTTYINSMINELGDAGKTVGKILQERTGKSFGQLMQDGSSLADVLQILLDSVDGNAEALMGLWGSQEAGKAANAIISQSVRDFNQVLAQMNAEMAGTTGTTEQAYETMTSTSEFIDRRLNNSVKNLAIAYGDMLAPPMDAIKTLSADILEGLTDLIQKSPVAASAIAAVSTGVVVLAGGLTALMIIEKVREAFGGFNALLTASPVLIAVAGVSALAMGIAALVTSTKDENKALEEFNQKLDDIDGSFHTELATVEVAGEQAGGYIDRLEELEEAGLKTTEQQEEYHEILVKLTETVPELSDLIDLETDTIKGGTKALRENTEAWVKNAKEQAYQKYLADLTEAHTKALIDQKKAEIELRKAKEKKAEQELRNGELIEKLNRLYAEAREKAADYNNTHEDFRPFTDFLDVQAVNEVRSEIDAFGDEMDETDKAIVQSEEDLADANETVAAAEEPLNQAKEAINELTEAENEAGDAVGAASGAILVATPVIAEAGKTAAETASKISGIQEKTPEITDSIQSWADKYGELYKAAKESLENQFKLWEEVEKVTAVSVKDANKGIQSQIDYWHRYNDDLNTIKDSGIAGMDLLYKHISDGSTDSVAMAAGIAAAIRDDNQPAVEEMIELYKDLDEAQGDTRDSMFEMQADMDAALEELTKSVDNAIGDMELPDEAWTAAHNTILAYARGLIDGTGSAENAAQSVVNATTRVLNGGKPSSKKKNRARKVTDDYANYYASGTNYATAGLALVGEEGPELVYLRGGERILNAEETRSVLRGLYDVPATSSYSGPAAPAAVGGGPAEAKTVTVVVPVELDGRELARVTAQTMGEEMLFNGY